MHFIPNVLRFFYNLKVYFITLMLSIVASYFAFIHIETIPKPETTIEMLKFLFTNHEGYLSSLLFTTIAFLLLFIFGITTIIRAFRLYEFIYLAICILVGVLGFGVFLFSFYFLQYSLLILSPILIIIAVLFVYSYLSTV